MFMKMVECMEMKALCTIKIKPKAWSPKTVALARIMAIKVGINENGTRARHGFMITRKSHMAKN
jgi:hypothetical protein